MEDVFETEVSKMWRSKLGFKVDDDKNDEPKNLTAARLWSKGLEPLLREREVDFTVAFRLLSKVIVETDESKLFQHVTRAFYHQKDVDEEEVRRKWSVFLKEWSDAVLEGTYCISQIPPTVCSYKTDTFFYLSKATSPRRTEPQSRFA